MSPTATFEISPGATETLSGTPYADRLITLPGVWPEDEYGGPGSLVSGVEALFLEQQTAWPELVERTAQLATNEQREIQVGDARHILIRNPGRERNTADFSRRAVAKRPCFLDAANFPAEERGIAAAGMFIAANPYPILDRHLTIIYPSHVDQSLASVIEPLYTIADELGTTDPEYFVYYNGAEAGASAPDHAHVQAGRLATLPIEDDIQRLGAGEILYSDIDGLTVSIPERLGRTVIVIESRAAAQTIDIVQHIVGQLAVNGDTQEPPLNLIARYGANRFRTMLFPRSMFRPRTFFDPVNGARLSPASLEMAGLLVVPGQDDFRRLSNNPAIVADAFHDVSPEPADITRLLRQRALAA